MRFSVREKIVELFELMKAGSRSFPLLSHLLTRPDRLESVTFLIAALELVRLGAAEAHQRTAVRRDLPDTAPARRCLWRPSAMSDPIRSAGRL